MSLCLCSAAPCRHTGAEEQCCGEAGRLQASGRLMGAAQCWWPCAGGGSAMGSASQGRGPFVSKDALGSAPPCPQTPSAAVLPRHPTAAPPAPSSPSPLSLPFVPWPSSRLPPSQRPSCPSCRPGAGDVFSFVLLFDLCLCICMSLLSS